MLTTLNPERLNVVRATAPLDITTYVPVGVDPDQNQALHSGIAYIPGGFGPQKKRWWYCFSPMPGSTDIYENPCVVCADDPEGPYEIPTGGTNPIRPTVYGEDTYNPDATLCYDPDTKTLYCFAIAWVPSYTFIIYTSTTDGVTWTDYAVLAGTSGYQPVSPGVVYNNGTWHIWFRDKSTLVAGSFGSQVSGLWNDRIYGANSTSTNAGILYGSLTNSGTTRTINLYKSSAGGAGNLVASGSKAGDGQVALSQANSSGVSGYLTVTYTADATNLAENTVDTRYLCYGSTDSLATGLSSITKVNLPPCGTAAGGFMIWHLGVSKRCDSFVAAFQGNTPSVTETWFATSSDGVAWTIKSEKFTAGGVGEWDQAPYRGDIAWVSPYLGWFAYSNYGAGDERLGITPVHVDRMMSVDVRIKDAAGALIDADSDTFTVTAANEEGTSRTAQLGTVTRASEGHYTVAYTVPFDHPCETVILTFTFVVDSVTYYQTKTLVVVDKLTTEGFSLDFADQAEVAADVAGLDGASMLTQANVRAALGMASANLDTQLGDVPTVTEMTAAFTEIKGATWSSGTDTLEHIRDKEADIEADTQDLQTQVGTDGAGLTALPWNAAWDAEVQSECTDALNAYDPPTNAEMVARTKLTADYADKTTLDTVAGDVAGLDGAAMITQANVRTAVGLASANLDTQLADIPTVAEMEARTLVAASYFDPATDVVAHVTLVDTTTTVTNAVTASGIPTAAANADAVWDEARSGHTGTGTFGEGVASVQGNVTGNVASVTGAVGSVTAGVTVTTNNDKTGYALTSAYDAAKTAAQAGNAMALTSDERTATALVVAAEIVGNGMSIEDFADELNAVGVDLKNDTTNTGIVGGAILATPANLLATDASGNVSTAATNQVALSSTAQSSLVAAIEVELANDATGEALMQAIADKLEAEFDIESLTLAAIATACRDAILDRVLATNHEVAGSPGKLLQNADVATSTRSTFAGGAVASVTAPVTTTKDTVIDTINTDAAAAKTAAEAGKLVTDKVDTMLQASGDNYQLTTDALENAPTGVTNYTIGSATTGEVGGMNLTAYQNKRFRDFTTGLPFAIPGASALTGKSLAFVVSKVKGAALWSLTSASSQITVGGTGDKYAYVSDDDTHTGTAGKYEWSLHNLTDDDLVNRGYLDIERCVEMPST